MARDADDREQQGSFDGGSGQLSPRPDGVQVQHPRIGAVSYPIHDYPQNYPGVDGDGDLAATIFYYLRIVIKRKWLIACIALVSLVLGALFALTKTPIYASSVRIQIEREAAKIVEGGETTPSAVGTDFFRTQYELLKSRSLADRVVSALELQFDEGFLAPRNVSAVSIVQEAIAGSAPKSRMLSPLALQATAIGIVQDNVAIRPVPGSRLVDIQFKDPDARRAQRVANAYADAFVASNLDKRFQANAYAKTFLEDQVQQLKLRLQESEGALLKFAEQEQIVAVSDKASIAENNLAAANASLGVLISERIKNEQLWKQVQSSQGFGLPQLLSNSVVDGLRARKNTLTTEYEEKLETYKPSYPAMVQISQKIKEIDRQLSSEVTTIRASLRAAYDSSANQEAEMRSRIATLRTEVLDLQKRSAQYNILRREVETNRKLYNSLLQRLKQVDIASSVGTNSVFIVDKAQRADAPSEPRVARILALALALGLGLGFGSAYLLEIMDDRVRVPEEIEEITGLPTLGIIPAAESDEQFAIQLGDPQSAISEAYRSLATALQFSTESGLPRSIAITSAGPGEGKSSTAVAIARHFAVMGMKVLLIDADLRKPSLHAKLERDNSRGLSNYLTGSSSPPETFQDTDFPNLTFMASGPLPPNAADLLGGTRVFSLISVGSEAFDLIVIDGPPLLGLADAQLISSAVSATVFVVGSGQSKKGAIRNAIRRLGMARGQVVGSVLTRFDSKSSGYGYGYGYSYAYSDHSYQYGVSGAGQAAALSDEQGR